MQYHACRLNSRYTRSQSGTCNLSHAIGFRASQPPNQLHVFLIHKCRSLGSSAMQNKHMHYSATQSGTPAPPHNQAQGPCKPPNKAGVLFSLDNQVHALVSHTNRHMRISATKFGTRSPPPHKHVHALSSHPIRHVLPNHPMRHASSSAHPVRYTRIQLHSRSTRSTSATRASRPHNQVQATLSHSMATTPHPLLHKENPGPVTHRGVAGGGPTSSLFSIKLVMVP